MNGYFPSFGKILLIFSIPLVFGSCAYMNVSGPRPTVAHHTLNIISTGRMNRCPIQPT